MSWHPNSNKHKANHCGYKSKPSRKSVLALMNLYAKCSDVAKNSPTKKQIGIQLKLEF